MAREFKLRILPVLGNPEVSQIEVSLSYTLGGMNYFTGKVESRGYYLHVTPVKVSPSSCGKYTTRTYTAFTGVKKFMDGGQRFSRNHLQNVLPPLVEKDVEELVKHVCNKNGLSLAEEL